LASLPLTAFPASEHLQYIDYYLYLQPTVVELLTSHDMGSNGLSSASILDSLGLEVIFVFDEGKGGPVSIPSRENEAFIVNCIAGVRK
jgi:hypothetical protein